jgi:hypothetical protein
MGRYYSGDIEGKFWFGVQSSKDAEFFGGEGHQPEEIQYWFDKSHLDSINEGLRICQDKMGYNKDRFNEFFKGRKTYNDDLIESSFQAKYQIQINVREQLKWYARYLLGREILECVEKQSDCSFTAEL